MPDMETGRNEPKQRKQMRKVGRSAMLTFNISNNILALLKQLPRAALENVCDGIFLKLPRKCL